MQLTIAMQTFNEKLRQMNQTNGKQLVLTAQEARNLHADLFSLITEIAILATSTAPAEKTEAVMMDGGRF